MGPINLQWYRDRGIDHTLQQYAGGRIDVYGLPDDEFYEGRTAMGLPIMTAECFNDFSIFLQDVKTHKPLKYNQLVELYYLAGHPILDYAPEPVAT
jgi:hypothetical protein